MTKSQPIFSFENTEGTLAGFWTPDYAQGIGVAGFHLHYIDDERSGGGHVFDYVIENCTIQICQKAHMHLALPETADFMAAELSRENLEDNIATRKVRSKGETVPFWNSLLLFVMLLFVDKSIFLVEPLIYCKLR